MPGELPPVSAEGWPLVPRPGRRRQRAERLRKQARRLALVVFARDRFACVLCGVAATVDGLTVDHVRPLAYGGTNELANLRTLCEPCNHLADDEFYRRAWLARLGWLE